jgi:hypothetical protein
VLYFSVYPKGWLPPAEVSENRYSIEGFATIVMTCGLAAMGAGYGRLLEAENQMVGSGVLVGSGVRPSFEIQYNTKNGAGIGSGSTDVESTNFSDYGSVDSETDGYRSADSATATAKLLCLAASIFLVASSARSFFGKCPVSSGSSGSARCNGIVRGFLRVAVGVSLGALGFFLTPSVSEGFILTPAADQFGAGASIGLPVAMLVTATLIALAVAETWMSRTVIRG